jgi:1-acyl-sn-glycerol-3-phosphate acyltransferase
MFRSAILVTLGVVFTGFVSAFIFFLYPLFPRGERTVHTVAVRWAKLMLRLAGVEVEVRGADNVLVGRSQIFMANHQSGFDILALYAHVPTFFCWIAKKELFEVPVFGKALTRTGSIAIDRKNYIKAMRSINEAAKKIRDGKSVMTFPEGTRSEDGHILPFKKGVFHLALKAGVPIIPVTIIGSRQIMPKKSLQLNPGKIVLVFEKPVEVKEYSVEDVDTLADRVQETIVTRFYGRNPDVEAPGEGDGAG